MADASNFYGYCIFIILSCISGIIFGIFNWIKVFNIKIDHSWDQKQVGDQENLVEDNLLKVMNQISEKIQNVIIL